MECGLASGSDEQAYIFWWLVEKYCLPLADNVPGLEVTRRKDSHESRRDIIRKQASEQLEHFKSEIVKKSDNVPEVEDYFFALPSELDSDEEDLATAGKRLNPLPLKLVKICLHSSLLFSQGQATWGSRTIQSLTKNQT